VRSSGSLTRPDGILQSAARASEGAKGAAATRNLDSNEEESRAIAEGTLTVIPCIGGPIYIDLRDDVPPQHAKE
jgi:hypothetical protein